MVAVFVAAAIFLLVACVASPVVALCSFELAVVLNFELVVFVFVALFSVVVAVA